jgi:hypothetical protein
MNCLRAGLPSLPPKMAHLPIDARGFPVPYFVAKVNGVPDHRIAEPDALQSCVERNLCWLCGTPLGRYKAFCIGPMCTITRTISEPPQHLECSLYAATACPFLTRPHAKRRDAGMPENTRPPSGMFLRRNPGAVCVWVTKSHRPFRYGDGLLFDLGQPVAMYWYAEGRQATREEVNDSIVSGLAALRAEAERDGPAAVVELAKRLACVLDRLDVDLPQEG